MNHTSQFNKQQILQEVTTIVSKKLNIAPERVTPDATLESLGADSLDLVEIIINCEERFNVAISDQDAQHLTDVNSVVNYIDGLLHNS
jgi:acyl carrier protein